MYDHGTPVPTTWDSFQMYGTSNPKAHNMWDQQFVTRQLDPLCWFLKVTLHLFPPLASLQNPAVPWSFDQNISKILQMSMGNLPQHATTMFVSKTWLIFGRCCCMAKIGPWTKSGPRLKDRRDRDQKLQEKNQKVKAEKAIPECQSHLGDVCVCFCRILIDIG